MIFMAVANNLGVMWAAIEATTLVSVFLVTFYGKVTSLEAAWKYAIIGGVGLSMALFGTLVTYYAGHRLAGSDALAGLNWSVLAQHAGLLDKTSMRLAFVLILMGYGTKAGLAPMHTWKPDAYSEAPVPSAAILSTALLNCALYGLIRFYILTSRSLGPEYPGHLLLLFGLLSMGISVPFILAQKNLRRLLAYPPSIMPVSWSRRWDSEGRWAALGLMLHMTFHTIAKSLLFLCAGNVRQHFKTDLFSEIKGSVIRVMPLTGVVFLMAMLAIIGMPPFSLFQSEFLIVRAAFDGGHLLTGVLFVLFGTGVFAGALLHVGGMILGPKATCRLRRAVPGGMVHCLRWRQCLWSSDSGCRLLFSADSRRGQGGDRAMTTFFDELHDRFPDLVRSVEEAVSDQVVVLLNGPDVTAIVRHFLTAHQARIVTVFAEDRVNAEGVFYNYYVFDRPGDPSWVILKAPIPERLSFVPLAGRGVAGDQLAGARDSGLVRPRSRRPSESASRRAPR